MRVDSPALGGKRSRTSHRTARRGWSHFETRVEASCVVPHSQTHQFPRPLKISSDAWNLFECNPEDEFITRSGTDTLVASSRKRHCFQIQLDKWSDIPWTTWEASGVPCLSTRRGLTPLYQVRRDPEIDVRNGEECWASCLTSRWSPTYPAAMREESEGAPLNAKGDLTSLRRHQVVPQVDTQLERNPKLPATTARKPEIHPARLMRPLTLQHFQRKPTFPLRTWKGTRHALGNSRSFPRYPSLLERNTDFPTTSQEEPRFPRLKLRWG